MGKPGLLFTFCVTKNLGELQTGSHWVGSPLSIPPLRSLPAGGGGQRTEEGWGLRGRLSQALKGSLCKGEWGGHCCVDPETLGALGDLEDHRRTGTWGRFRVLSGRSPSAQRQVIYAWVFFLKLMFGKGFEKVQGARQLCSHGRRWQSTHS